MNAKRQIPHVMKYLLTSWRALLASLALFGMLGSIDPALATTVTAVNGLSCAGSRYGSALNCTAGEFTTIVSMANQPGSGSPTSCVAGDYVTLIGSVSLTGTNADRYNVGFFTGENGNAPSLTTGTCSVATFPTTSPWLNLDSNTCGDYPSAGTDAPNIQNIKLLCAGDAAGNLMVPYVLSYQTNAGNATSCTGPGDVKPEAKSKCNSGTATVAVNTFAVNGSVTVTKKTVPVDNAQSFSFTAIGAGTVMSGDASFNLVHDGSKQVRMGITGTGRTLTITEAATTDWESTATIACTKPDGSSSAGFVTTNGATRTITATLSNSNPNAKCTITNTRAVSAANSTVVANPTFVASDGVSTSTITVTLKDTSGGVVAGKTVTLTAGSGSSTITTLTGVTGVNGEATFTVKDAVAESVTYTATDTTDGITISQTATVTFFSVSSFNAFETSTAASAITGSIYTKLAGTVFGLDVVAIASSAQATGFSGNVKVELLANTNPGTNYGGTNPNCPNAFSIIQTIASAAISGGRSNVNTFTSGVGAYRDVRVRISYPTTSPTVTTCSTDSFAIRPAAFTITSSSATGGTAATNTGTSGSPVIKAGASFNLTATAVAGYDGTPSLDATKVIGSSTAGTLSGSFGTASSGVAVGNAFTYSEVGSVGLNANAVYDTSFTSNVDPSGSDCTADFSNVLVGGKYGCKIGSTAVPQTTDISGFGRFIPDHFDTAVKYDSVAKVFMPCPSGLVCPPSEFAWSYPDATARTTASGFVATDVGRIAWQVGDNTFWELTAITPVWSAASSPNGFVYSGQPFSVQVTAKNAGGNTTQNYQGAFAKDVTLSSVTAGGGAAIPTAAPGGTLSPNSAAASSFAGGSNAATLAKPVFTFATTPTAPTDVYVRAMDTDSVTSLRGASSVEGGVKVVSGRIKIPNVYGSERLPLPMTATVQYYNGTYWVTSTTDSTTAFNSNLSTATPTAGNVVASVVSGLGSGVVVSSPSTSAVVAGVRIVTLNAPGELGSANISLNAPAYLPTVTGRATFGIYKSRLIYRRENY